MSRSLVALGGGTGLAVVLRGLKQAVASSRLVSLSAVVTVTDDGGSSGRLRRDFGVLPPGDIRNCIAALADDEDLLTRLFQYRFPLRNGDRNGQLSGERPSAGQPSVGQSSVGQPSLGQSSVGQPSLGQSSGASSGDANGDPEGLFGHSFGNLFLTALAAVTGDFYQAISTVENILSVRGNILPATLTDLRLAGRGVSGRRYDGEVQLGTASEPLDKVWLEPADPPAFAPAVEAIQQSDLVLLGPGSLYTSILPNLLIPGIREALRQRRALSVLPLNLMTQPGETDEMDALAHVQALERQAGAGLVDVVLVHRGPLPAGRVTQYAQAGSRPVEIDRQALEALGVEVVACDLLADGELLRHDPQKLSGAVLGLLRRPAEV
ncbi:MAG: uridine diphosphate-N-acetylglucosamine-binding protein YvcK [Acidobacteriota bacterium]